MKIQKQTIYSLFRELLVVSGTVGWHRGARNFTGDAAKQKAAKKKMENKLRNYQKYHIRQIS